MTHMYARLNERGTAKLHLVKRTGWTVCNLRGTFLSYHVEPDGPVCSHCIDGNEGYPRAKREFKGRA